MQKITKLWVVLATWAITLLFAPSVAGQFVEFSALQPAELPAEIVSTSTSNLKWFTMKLQNEVLGYTADNELVGTAGDMLPFKSAVLWAVTGSNATGYTFYNKEAGTAKMLSANNQGVLVKAQANATNNEKFTVYRSTFGNGSGFAIAPKGQQKTINLQQNKAKFWRRSGWGSTFYFQTINIPQMAQEYVSAAGFVGSFPEADLQTLKSKLNTTEGEIQAALNALDPSRLITYQDRKIYQLIPVNNKSQRLMALDMEQLGVSQESLSQTDLRTLFSFYPIQGQNAKIVYNHAADAYLKDNGSESYNNEVSVKRRDYTVSECLYTVSTSDQVGAYYIAAQYGQAHLGLDQGVLVGLPANQNPKWHLKEVTLSDAERNAINACKGKYARLLNNVGIVGGCTSQALSNITLSKTAAEFQQQLTAALAGEKLMLNPNKAYIIRSVERPDHIAGVWDKRLVHGGASQIAHQRFTFVPQGNGQYKITTQAENNAGFVGEVARTQQIMVNATGAAYVLDLHNMSADADAYVVIKTANAADEYNCWNVQNGDKMGGWKYIGNNNRPVNGSLWQLIEDETCEVVHFGKASYVSYSSAQKRSIPAALSVHKARVLESDKVRITPADETVSGDKVLEARTGVLLKATAAGSHFLPFSQADANLNLEGNALRPAVERTPLQAGQRVYVLWKNANETLFKATKPGIAIPAGKAYLDIPVTGNAPEFLSIWTDNPTGINAATVNALPARGFDLSGRATQLNAPGLYIVNGQKVFVGK